MVGLGLKLAVLPCGAVIMSGLFRKGVFCVVVANFFPNSPKLRCWDFLDIKQKFAMSQNAVAPPFPKTILYSWGMLKSWVSSFFICWIRFFMGGFRWEVPNSCCWFWVRCCSCSGRIFVGPAPNLPSVGRRFFGIVMFLCMVFY